jgi:hypothetical protein
MPLETNLVVLIYYRDIISKPLKTTLVVLINYYI